MSDLFHLPVPLFLPYEFGLVACLLAWVWGHRLYIQRAPGSKPRPQLNQFSTYDLAFLVGGPGGVIKTAVFALDLKGFLARASKDEITVLDAPTTAPTAQPEPAQAPPYRPLHNPAQLNLDPIEQHVYFHLRSLGRAPSSKEIMSDAALKTRLEPVYDAIRQRMADAGLTNAGARKLLLIEQVIAGSLLAIATLYKCYVSSPYSNFTLLLLLAAAGLVGVALAGRGLGLTRRGKELLEEARKTQQELVSAGARADVNDPASAPLMADYSHGPMLGMAVVGVAAMAGTDYAYYSDVFKANQAGSSGCGGCSSCSSCGGCGG